MRAEITFIIPVFNNGNYLRQCLETVCGQSFQQTEIICINDGSFDNSRSILEEFSSLDSRVRIIDNSQNVGAAESRNRGIAEATGRFIRFVDADDLLPARSTERLYSRAVGSGSDVARGGLALFHEEDTSDCKAMIEVADRVTTLRKETSLWLPFWHTSYLISRSLIQTNGLKYPPLQRGEDPLFLASVLVNAKQIALLSDTVYLYRRYPKTSGSAGTSFAHVRDFLASAAGVKSLFAEHCPECWQRGYGPFLLDNFRRFVPRCALNAKQMELALSEASRLWDTRIDLATDDPLTKSTQR